jgi:hypothetical protein
LTKKQRKIFPAKIFVQTPATALYAAIDPYAASGYEDLEERQMMGGAKEISIL